MVFYNVNCPGLRTVNATHKVQEQIDSEGLVFQVAVFEITC